MIRINIYEAKTRLSSYLERLRAGETILLCKRNVPVAEIRPLPAPSGERRPVGLAAGTFRVPKSFFEPLPEDVIAAFRGGTK
ncbi:MAG: type II toxin-antitoxin system Phd/YefM family antitoxin [Deltaproteobacteria bacterium]|nr:type II toxin-antitoxin system Phd/YefM family antitoxin [Deltaproteobacteria bacterium]